VKRLLQTASVAQALEGVADGSTVLIGGFGTAGIPTS
jgi:3-oxoadipate CoA-transferase alpha subunit